MPITQVYDVFRDNIDEDSTLLWFHVKTSDNRSVYFHIDYEKHPVFSSLLPIMDLGPSRAEHLRDEAAKLIKNMPGVLPDFSGLPQIEDTSLSMQEVFSQLEASDSMMSFVDFEDHLWEDLDLTQKEFENQLDADIDKYLLSDVIEKNQGESLYVCYANLLTRFSVPAPPEQVQVREREDEKPMIFSTDREILILDKKDRSRTIYEGPLSGHDQAVLHALKDYREKLESSLPLVDKLILANKNTPFPSPNAIPLLELYKYGVIKNCFYRDLQQTDFNPIPCMITDYRFVEGFNQDCFNVLYLDSGRPEKNTGRGTWAFPSNLVIDIGSNTGGTPSRNAQLLNRHGLVSKEQLARLDAIIGINKHRGKRKPKDAAEKFAYEFAKLFKTKYMEHPEDIKRFKLNKNTRTAVMCMLGDKFTPNEIVETILEYSPAPSIANGDQQERMKFAMETVLDSQRNCLDAQREIEHGKGVDVGKEEAASL